MRGYDIDLGALRHVLSYLGVSYLEASAKPHRYFLTWVGFAAMWQYFLNLGLFMCRQPSQHVTGVLSL